MKAIATMLNRYRVKHFLSRTGPLRRRPWRQSEQGRKLGRSRRGKVLLLLEGNLIIQAARRTSESTPEELMQSHRGSELSFTSNGGMHQEVIA